MKYKILNIDKELLPYLEGTCSLEEAVANLKTQTRHYAKRQLSWFRRMPQANMVYVDDYPDSAALVQNVLHIYETFCKENA